MGNQNMLPNTHRKFLHVDLEQTSLDFFGLFLSFFTGIHHMKLCSAGSVIFILRVSDL